jgi:hypothetical protein
LILVGCGASADPPPTHSTASTAPATGAAFGRKIGRLPQPAGDKFTSKNAEIAKHDRRACESAVRSAPALNDAAKKEIATLCFRINYVPEDNERTVRSICQEVANASSLTSEAARKRTATACYVVGMG